MPIPCTVCLHPKRVEIDAALVAGTSWRGIGSTFGPSKDAIGRHSRAHLGVNVPSKRSTANAKKRAQRLLASKISSLRPIEGPQDVVDDLQRLRSEAFALFDEAKARADWRGAEKLFSQLVSIVDRFAEMHRVLGPKGTVNVTVDRSTKVLTVLGDLSDEDLRALLARSDAGDSITLPVPV